MKTLEATHPLPVLMNGEEEPYYPADPADFDAACAIMPTLRVSENYERNANVYTDDEYEYVCVERLVRQPHPTMRRPANELVPMMVWTRSTYAEFGGFGWDPPECDEVKPDGDCVGFASLRDAVTQSRLDQLEHECGSYDNTCYECVMVGPSSECEHCGGSGFVSRRPPARSYTVRQVREWLEGWQCVDGAGNPAPPLSLHQILTLLDCDQDGIIAHFQHR